MTTTKKEHPAQFKVGHKKLGGRKAGTPNKNTVAMNKVVEKVMEQVNAQPREFNREFIQWLGNYWLSTNFLESWAMLNPYQKFLIFDRLYQFGMPKKTSETNELILNVKRTIEDDLIELAQEFPDE